MCFCVLVVAKITGDELQRHLTLLFAPGVHVWAGKGSLYSGKLNKFTSDYQRFLVLVFTYPHPNLDVQPIVAVTRSHVLNALVFLHQTPLAQPFVSTCRISPLLIAHQARSSITPQVKIKNCRKGKLCGIGGIYLQILLLLRSQGSRCLGTTGTNPSAPANPWNSTGGTSSNFLCQTDALAPLGPQHPPHWKPEDAIQQNAQRPNPKGQTNTLPPSNNLAWLVVLSSLQSPYPPDRQWT